MKIINLKAENFKRLVAIDVTPSGDLNIVAGKNAQGKTSLLDAIFVALAGKSALKNTPKPIREGQDKAEITLDLGDFIVRRTFTQTDNYLTVTAKDGTKYKSPQDFLNKIIGNLSFDPLAFANMSEKEQTEVLLQVAKLDVDPRKIDEEKKTLYDQRTVINRDIKNLNAQISGIPVCAEPLPEKEFVLSELLDMIKKAQMTKLGNDTKRDQLKGLVESYNSTTQKIAELQEDLERVIETGKSLRPEVEALKDPDIEGLQHQLENAEEINKRVRLRDQRKQLEVQLYKHQATVQDIEGQMNSLEDKKQTALKNAQLPIKGMGLEDGIITYKGIPFKQCSAAEQLKISLAMAMSLNPELRVIRIMDGSLLDKDNLKIISNTAKAMDFQIWVERVDESGEIGFIIENGELKNND